MSTEGDDAWAQLVSVTDIESSPIPLVKQKYTIGRGIDCDVSLSENKLVSTRHCYIERDKDGKVWLNDSSTNGTLLNLNTKLSKGDKRELQHGDEFYVVYKKNDMEKNVGYMYQDMKELQREEEATQEYSSDIGDATLVDDEVNMIDSSPERCGQKRPADDETELPESKKQKKDTEKIDIKSSKSESFSSLKKDQDKPKVKEKKDMEEMTKESKELAEKEKAESKETAEKEKADSSGENKIPAPATKGPDEIEEALLCIICQELLHDCISLQPCMHSFCSGCYSEWMERSNECPSCRMKVERLNKNHIVNNLIEAYLKENPDKKRSEEDLKELDAKNKITRDMLYPVKKKRTISSSSESSYYGDSGDSDGSDDTIDPVTIAPLHPPAPGLFGFGTPVFGINRAARTLCRQCPGYVEPATIGNTAVNTANTANTGIIQNALNTVKNALGIGGNATNEPTTATDGAAATGSNAEPGEGSGEPSGDTVEASTSGEGGPSTSANPDVKVMPTPPDFTCTPVQNHVLCQCCMQPMPDRRTQHYADPVNIPPQQCTICYRAFCHAYWGCKRIECSGCIGKFKDMNFGRKSLNNLILDNQYESEILKDYLESKNLSVKDMLQECLTKLDAGVYTCTDLARFRMSSNFVMCYPCALRNFKDLAYLYRKNIPKDQLPEAVRNRQDCYWGKNCRTQRNKPHHAKNFSHICDQTRTML